MRPRARRQPAGEVPPSGPFGPSRLQRHAAWSAKEFTMRPVESLIRPQAAGQQFVHGL